MNRISPLLTPLPLSSCSVPTRRRYPGRANRHSKRVNLKPLTSRIVLLTRRRQLDQIVEEVEAAKKRYGRLNTIVMNSVLEACVHCGDVDLALRLFDEMAEPELRPKPHLYMSMMRAFAVQGDYGMVRNLYLRLWPDSSGRISKAVQQEADNLLMEAALNAGQLDEALGILTSIVKRWKAIPWTTSGGMAAVRLEALLGFSKSILRPHILSKVIPGEPIESIMIPFEATRPLLGTLQLKNVVMRFYKEQVVPIVDDWGSCIGLLHREDCNNLDASLVSMMRSPPPCVSTTTSIGRVVDLVLEKKHKMVIVIHCCGSGYSSKAVGAFTRAQLYRLFEPEQKLLWWIKRAEMRSIDMFTGKTI
ncbi:hypothetical protein F2Q68_00007225 [Brassica cretica]|uniref:CBS domain-containing protein n=1 Tax=Brassica cretica TaxID=69181 RepID=A0A8S9KUA8_BRACR|nr:hypothetical protein F2Q68_00007225 [Brassica cretica]